MPNTIKTLSDGDIANEALRILKNSNGILKKVDRQYDDQIGTDGHKNGGTLLIREPNRYTVSTGRTITAQDTTEVTTSVVVGTQKNVPVQFYSDQLKLSIDDFSARILKPAMSVLASDIAKSVALAGAQGFTNYVGSPGTAPTSFLTFAQAGERLDWQTAPRDGDRSVILNPTAMAAVVDAQKGLFAPSSAVGDQYKSGMLDSMTGFDFVMDQSLPAIAHGAGASYTTHGTTPLVSGTATMAIITGTGALTAGQQFTVAGVNEVNPDTKSSTGQLKVFTVASDFAGGAGNVTLSETIYTSGARQNVSAAIPTTTALTLIGSASTTYVRNLAFHKSALVLATAPLPLPKGVDMAYQANIDGLSLRFVRFYDGTNDNFIGRFDILYGVKVVRPSWGCVVYG
jgi:hypothetical protein